MNTKHSKWIEAAALAAILLAVATIGVGASAPGSDAPAGKSDQDKTAKGLAAPRQAWQPHGCEASEKAGVLRVTGEGRSPLLCLPVERLPASATLRFRLKCDGGSGKVFWTEDLAAKSDKASKSGDFMVKAGGWTVIKKELVANNRPGFVALRLPLPAVLDWVELTADGKTTRWEFDK
jgi:hypothetical protein